MIEDKDSSIRYSSTTQNEFLDTKIRWSTDGDRYDIL